MKRNYFMLQKGFSLIEVLVSMCLLCLFSGWFMTIEIRSLQTVKGAFFQSIAIEQLRFASMLVRENPDNFSGEMRTLQQNNQKLLPGGEINIQHHGDHYVVRCYWLSNIGYFWHCTVPKRLGFACVELSGLV